MDWKQYFKDMEDYDAGIFYENSSGEFVKISDIKSLFSAFKARMIEEQKGETE